MKRPPQGDLSAIGTILGVAFVAAFLILGVLCLNLLHHDGSLSLKSEDLIPQVIRLSFDIPPHLWRFSLLFEDLSLLHL